MMTLDEAILHAEEVAKAQSDLFECYLQHGEQGDHVEECLDCAIAHRQLAEWLRELKAYKGRYHKYYKAKEVSSG